MKAIPAFLSLLAALSAAPRAEASGCMHYDSFRRILSARPHEVLSGGFQVLSRNERVALVRLADGAEILMTASRKPDLPVSAAPALHLLDFIFEEGHGCGPVYECASGLYRLMLPSESGLAAYEYPAVEEFRDDPAPSPWKMEEVIPTFTGLRPAGDPIPGHPQCVLGFW